MTRFLILLLLLSGLFGGEKRSGRRGNALYHQERYDEAASAYREGLAEIPDRPSGPLTAALLNNLGAALYRQGDFEGSRSSFGASAGFADAPSDVVRGTYNAGNAAFRAQALEEALAFYRRALLRDPSNGEARFNYEFVRRQLEQQEQEQQDQQQQEQQEQQDQQQEQQEQQPQNPDELSQEEAERMLEALQNEEEQLLRQVQKMKARPRRVEKDW